MDKKTIVTIIIATIFALIATFVIFKKNTTVTSENQDMQQQEIIVKEDKSPAEDLQETAKTEDIDTVEKAPTLKKITKPNTKNATKNEITNEPAFDKVVVQEGSVIEEVEEDYGIKKVGNIIEVTREFKIKSPTKYSFKGFGILDNVSTK